MTSSPDQISKAHETSMYMPQAQHVSRISRLCAPDPSTSRQILHMTLHNQHRCIKTCCPVSKPARTFANTPTNAHAHTQALAHTHATAPSAIHAGQSNMSPQQPPCPETYQRLARSNCTTAAPSFLALLSNSTLPHSTSAIYASATSVKCMRMHDQINTCSTSQSQPPPCTQSKRPQGATSTLRSFCRFPSLAANIAPPYHHRQ